MYIHWISNKDRKFNNPFALPIDLNDGLHQTQEQCLMIGDKVDWLAKLLTVPPGDFGH